MKNSGFGRNEYEALKTAIFNLIEHLLEDEKFINPIKESLKIFLRNIKDPNYNRENKNVNKSSKYSNSKYAKITETDDIIPSNSDLESNSNQDIIGYSIIKTEAFNLLSKKENYDLHNIKESIKEKDLIIIELEKLVIDIMNYNKVNNYFNSVEINRIIRNRIKFGKYS
jgi:hypothetical protein